MLNTVIPVKYSERLPYKHFLKLGGKSLLEIARDKALEFGNCTIYSRIDLPIPFLPDTGESIIHLMNRLTTEIVGSFLILGPDMPFIKKSDIDTLVKMSEGRSIIPVHKDGQYEPMFAIYEHGMKFDKSLFESFRLNNVRTVSTDRFSSGAFFNINTPEDYLMALRIYRGIQ